MIKLGNQEITLKIGSATCTVYLGDTMVESGDTPTPPTPSFNGKWLATYTGGTTSSAQCDASSAITQGEMGQDIVVAVEIGDCVESIDESAFQDCSGLTSVTIPNSVTSIGSYAFYNCSGLTSVTIPNTVTSIGQSAFESCSSLTSITIPNGVTAIDGYAFYNCTSLETITIPSGVTSIGTSAFTNCNSLTSITIPNNVTSIGNGAFMNCNSLTSITIPSGVTDIGKFGFRDCSGLTSITVLATTPPTLSFLVFNDTNDCPIYVPAQSLSAYQSANRWSSYASRIQAIP